MRLSFSLTIALFVALVHLYVYRRLIRNLAPDAAWRRGLGALLVVMALVLVLRRPIRSIGPDVERVHTLLSNGWVSLILCLFLALLVAEVIRLAASAVRWVRARLVPNEASDGETRERAALAAEPPLDAARDAGVDLDRRRFVAQSLHLGVLAGGGVTSAYGALSAFGPPEVTEVELRLPRLPKTLDGLCIVQLTDIHVGTMIDRAFVDRLVDMANAERPDLVAITGDLVDGDVAVLGNAVAALGRLRSRYGTFFVTGNHEYYSGELEWCHFLETIGVTVLRNRRTPIGDAGGTFDLVGVDDWSGGRRRSRRGYDLNAALAGRDTDRAAVLLAHQPANFDEATARGVGLQLSGHTHGGQVFPLTLMVGLGWEYSRGLYRRGDSHIYVSRGCGFWGPPARIGSPPEIVKIHLTV